MPTPRQLASTTRSVVSSMRRAAGLPPGRTSSRIAVVEEASPLFELLTQHGIHRRQQRLRCEAGHRGRECRVPSTTKSHSSGPMMVATWPGAIRHRNPACPSPAAWPPPARSAVPITADSDCRGTPSASMAATGAVVVSKPAAKNTTSAIGLVARDLHCLGGRAIGRTSAPAALRLVPANASRLCHIHRHAQHVAEGDQR